jgi:transcriptional regulator with XRE-family HTH domain
MKTPSRSPRPDLTRLRRRAGLTQRQLADALGLASVRAVSAWETGAYAPNVELVLPLARVLGVSVEEVVEAVSGADPGEDRVGKEPVGDLPPAAETELLPIEALASLAQHLDEAARLVKIVQAGFLPANEAGSGGADPD